MGADAYFLLTALPALDPPAAAPPLSLAELMERVPRGRARALVRCVILSDDLLQREAALAGELATPTPAVLTPEQALGTAPLPDDLSTSVAGSADGPEVAGGLRTPADVVWSSYYRWADALARRLGSAFLQEWVGSEVAVRNALAVARARVLGLDPARHVVARDLEGGDGAAADVVVAALAASPDPLAGLRELIALRWRWVEQHEPRYSFGDDEFAAYAAKLVLAHRWERSAGGDES
jgi:hypothetical protein